MLKDIIMNKSGYNFVDSGHKINKRQIESG